MYTVITPLTGKQWKRSTEGFVKFFIDHGIPFKVLGVEQGLDFYNPKTDGPFIYIGPMGMFTHYRIMLVNKGFGIFKVDTEGIYIPLDEEKPIYSKSILICNSRFEYEKLRQSGLPVRGYIAHILPSWFQRSEKLGRLYRRIFGKYILWIGAVTPRPKAFVVDDRKGLIEFIKTLDIVFKKLPDIKVVMLLNIDRSLLSKLLFEECKLKLDNRIHVLTNLRIEDVIGLYSGAQLYVSTSKCEGYGQTIIEAMRCKCPTVYVDGHAHRDIGGNCGFKVPVKEEKYQRSLHYRMIYHLFLYDINELAEIIINALTEKREVINDMIQKAYSWSLEFTEDKLVPLHLRLLKRIQF